MSEAEKLSIIEGGNLIYMWLGATHMLSGYDHLLFIFGVVFFLTRFRDIVKYVTAFTVGHSVTLIYATFNSIQVNYFLIDAVIALSVCYIAFTNLDGFRKYLGINPPNMMLMITAMGLIHGFGLSTRLQELPLNEASLLLNIVSFNVGIELGQIGALVLMLLFIALWRNRPSFQAFSRIANYCLILAGVLLFGMQIYGYAYSSEAEEITATPEVTSSKAAPPEVIWKDIIEITIPARGELEYKLYLTKGSMLEYSWKTGGTKLFFDFHGEPAGDKTGYFKSFKESTDKQASGFLTAPFEGPHGWYWKNSSPSPVTVELKVKGDYKRLDVE
jgi:hypothetical protein